MFEDKTIAFIGSGNMATTIMNGLIRKGLVEAEQLFASDISAKRLAYVQETLGVRTTTDNVQAASEADIIVLAVKPQSLQTVASALWGHIPSQRFIISILAGTPLSRLKSALRFEHLVRAMPNTPAQVGMGMTVWTTSETVTRQQKALAQAILRATGKEIYVEEEKYLDMATALNGSGPAYLFLVLEALIDAGVQIGLPRVMAEELAMQTLLGSMTYAQRANLHPAQLRNQVTSPGGTTAAGLAAMEKGGLRAALADGVLAAYRRAQELGSE